MEKIPWHSLDISAALSRIGASDGGLTAAEAEQRLKQYGPNELPPGKADPVWILFLSQFNSPLMYIMLAAIGVSVYLGNISEAIFILVVMSSNAIVGFYQEHKANQSLRSLKSLIILRSRIIRDNTEREIDAAALVPGDIVILRAGDKVPADGRLIECRGLRVSEANLTGESRPVEKQTALLPVEAEIADRTNMVFMGTLVEDGSAKVLVVETGARTEYGDIVTLLKETPEEPTPLQQTIAKVTKIVGLLIFIAVSIIVLEGYLVGRDFEEVFSAALALFVSAIPEGLLPAITVVLALGMRRILKQKGLVRRLAATETLGGVTVIATDKTGTLTEGKMEVSEILVTDKALERDVLRIGALANDAFIENPGAADDRLIVRGTMTEQALLKAAHRAGFEKSELERKSPVIDRLFFSSEHKHSASLRSTTEGMSGIPGRVAGTNMLYVIGAPEQILKRSHWVAGVKKDIPIEGQEGKRLLARMDEMTAQGYRVVACAVREVAVSVKYVDIQDLVTKLTLVGFVVLNDPVRNDVPAAFELTKRAGIRTVIVTGDHRQTALAVARKVGFVIKDDEVLEGHEIEKMADDELRERTRTVALYARVSPRHKLRIVQAFQKNGEVVASFGDGVNDAPALKVADIGVAVGTEVDAVREVADIVLLDSGFGTIVKSVEQGRIIFNNIRKVFLYLITQDFSQFFLFMISIMLGLPLPLIAAQLLLVNLVESGLPDLALTLEQEKDGIMEEPPRRPKAPFLDHPSRYWMVSIFVVSGSLSMAFYASVLYVTGDIDITRTMMMVLMCFESLFLVFAVRSLKKSIFRRDIFSNRVLVGAVVLSFLMIVAAVYYEPLRRVFETVELSLGQWATVFGTNVVGIVIIDRLKRLFFGREFRHVS